MSLCQKCISNKTLCKNCKNNPIYKDLKNYFKEYEPVCPIGHTDCVCDPGYIYHYYPNWYKELYGNKTPQEIALICQDKSEDSPENTCWSYDTEDK